MLDSFQHGQNFIQNPKKSKRGENRYKKVKKLPLKFFLDIGVLETKYKIIDTNINLRNTLIDKGKHVDFQGFNGGHDYLSCGETLVHGLIYLIGIR